MSGGAAGPKSPLGGGEADLSSSLCPTIHAGCLVICTYGVLLRGASGSGKSALADSLVRRAVKAGNFAAHVADDRVALELHEGRVLARPAALIAGQMEVRGLGIISVQNEPAAVVRLVVDLLPAIHIERMPEPEAFETELMGVKVLRQPVPERTAEEAMRLVEHALNRIASPCRPLF